MKIRESKLHISTGKVIETVIDCAEEFKDDLDVVTYLISQMKSIGHEGRIYILLSVTLER